MSTLALTSNTLAGTAGAGQIEYNGQFYATDSNASRGQIQRLVQETAKASTSGTSIDFTGIPAWAKRVTVMFSGVSTSGTSNVLFQLGVGSTPTTTGYLCSGMWATTPTNYTTGFGIGGALAANILHGSIIISNITGNTWVAQGVFGSSNAATTDVIGGSVPLAGVLGIVRITTLGGTDTFDAGSINIMYEG